MSPAKLNTRIRLYSGAVFCWFLCVAVPITPALTTGSRTPTSDNHQLRVELSTDRANYRLREPVLVTVTLRNVGSESFLVTAEPTLSDSASGGHVSVEVADQHGKVMKGRRSYGEFWGLQNESLYNWIDRNRRLFEPGDFVGFTKSLEQLGFAIESPGRYRLQVKYWETDYSDWVGTKELEETKKKLLFPLWSGETESNVVWIEIQP